MKPEFKITNVRSTDQTRYLVKDNHICNFIYQVSPNKPSKTYLNKIEKTIIDTGFKSSYLLFDIQGKTWWCKEPEFTVVEYALKQTIGEISLWYVAGSSSQLVTPEDYSISGINGYQLIIGFN